MRTRCILYVTNNAFIVIEKLLDGKGESIWKKHHPMNSKITESSSIRIYLCIFKDFN